MTQTEIGFSVTKTACYTANFRLQNTFKAGQVPLKTLSGCQWRQIHEVILQVVFIADSRSEFGTTFGITP